MGPMGVTATCPARRVDLRVESHCESASSHDVALALSRAGGCPISDVLVRPPLGGGARPRLRFASVPAAAASVLLEAGKVTVSWVRAQVVLLPKPKAVCFRGLNPGQFEGRVEGAQERCFRCGAAGHRARDCANSVCCATCPEAGCPANYRLGGPSCSAPSVRSKAIRWGAQRGGCDAGSFFVRAENERLCPEFEVNMSISSQSQSLQGCARPTAQ